MQSQSRLSNFDIKYLSLKGSITNVATTVEYFRAMKVQDWATLLLTDKQYIAVLHNISKKTERLEPHLYALLQNMEVVLAEQNILPLPGNSTPHCLNNEDDYLMGITFLEANITDLVGSQFYNRSSGDGFEPMVASHLLQNNPKFTNLILNVKDSLYHVIKTTDELMTNTTNCDKITVLDFVRGFYSQVYQTKLLVDSIADEMLLLQKAVTHHFRLNQLYTDTIEDRLPQDFVE